MQTLAKITVVSVLGLAYLLATPLVSVSQFGDGISATKAYAGDYRDVGHGKRDKKDR